MTKTQNVYRLFYDARGRIPAAYKNAHFVPGSAIPSGGKSLLIMVPEGQDVPEGEFVGTAANWMEARDLA